MQAVAIGLSQYEHDFHLNDRNVEMQDTLKILGVILDSKLNFIAETPQDSKDGMVCPVKHIASYTKNIVVLFWILEMATLVKWRKLFFITIHFQLFKICRTRTF